jgi:Holliday junction resolvasome RuvABC ATP-dependent DNA helicase subunit
MINEKALEETFLNLPEKKAILLYGHAGYGKTYQVERLSRIFNLDIVKYPTFPMKKCIWFFEEAQKLSQKQQENIPEMLDNQIIFDFSVEPTVETRIYTIFATTNPNKISLPIRTRCFSFQLTKYKPEEIFNILKNIEIPDGWKHEIVKRTRLIPRLAVDTALYIKNLGDVERGFSNLGIDKIGLTETDRQYLVLLFREGCLSLNQISSRLTLNDEAVEEMIESYFKEVGWITISSRGRSLTEDGKKITLEVMRGCYR